MALSSTILDLIDAEIGVGPGYLRGRLRFVLELGIYNKNTSAVDTLYISDGGVYTSSTDTPANTQMLPRLIVPSIESTLYTGGVDLGHIAPLVIGQARIINNDGYYDAYMDFDDYSWAYREAILKVGDVESAYTTYEAIPGGVMKIIQPSMNEGMITVPFTPPLDDFNSTIQKNLYGGFAGCLKVSVPNGGGTSATVVDDYDLGAGDATIQFRFNVGTDTANRVLCGKKSSVFSTTDAGWIMYINSSNILRFTISDGTNGLLSSCGASGDYTDDTWYNFTAVVDRTNDEIRLYIDDAQVGSSGSISSMTGFVSNALDFEIGDGAGGGNELQANEMMDECRIWRKALSLQEIKENYDITMMGSENHLDCLYKMDEYQGTTLVQEVEGPALKSLSFQGGLQDDYIDFGDNFDIGASDDFTCGIWYKTHTSSGTLTLLSKGYGSTSTGWYLQLDPASNLIEAYVRDASANNATGSVSVTNIDDGTWQAAAMVINRTTDILTVYYLDKNDGTLTAGTTAPSIASVGDLSSTRNMLTSRNFGGGNEYSGRLCWAFAVKAVLSEAEIKTCLMRHVDPEYDDGLDSSGDTDDFINDATASWWPMDEGEFTTANDVLNSVDGALTGGPAWESRDGTLTNEQWGSTLEGMQDLAGLPKVLTYGRCRNVLPSLVDLGFYYFGVHEEAVKNTADVYAGGLTLDSTTDYTKNNAGGYFELATTYDYEITADVYGAMDANGNLIRTVPGIIEEIAVNKAGISSGDIDTASFQAYREDFPHDVGIFFGTEESTLSEAFEFLLKPRGFIHVDLTGKLKIKVLRDQSGDSPDYVLTQNDIRSMELIGALPPAWKVKIGYGRKWKTIDTFYTSIGLEEQDRQRNPYQYAAHKDPAVRTAEKDATVVTVDSAIYKAGDAAIEAQEVFAFRGKRMGIWRASIAKNMFRAEISDIISVTYDRFGFDSAKNLVCIGFKYDIASSPPVIDLTLMGPISYTGYIDPIR